ncbi:polymer-forming cytoskeletal protein [Bacillus sp. PS06]|uniref:polymer-forming cytoskeletal protein n=1 Tax=Bacillus sp. PS06 TaxID=2764176 RepID=UPI00178729DD|nr:polymer-forming cytoskeletal protein [Bacillus sp. PS06]MBD8071433.1 polymer-forming cytoskeletal protein [Bacillus sp. PS06]
MKLKILLSSALLIGLLAACGQDEPATSDKKESTETQTGSDVVTTASLVNEASAFVNAVSENGTWIIATLGDLTVDEEVVVAGEFRDKDKADGDIYRKIGLYTQDDDHNITASFTLTVPKLTVKSENLNIQGGTVKGDVYVEANGFKVHETATVDGNVYFANDEFKASATIDGNVTGATEVAGGTDVVTTASLVNDAAAFVNAVSENGTWIIATLGDLTIEQDVVVAGEFRNKDQADGDIYRKIGLYTQDADHNITASFTLTVPKLTVKSENLNIQGGTVKGDVYVEANGFQVHETATIDGNVYFANEEYKASAQMNGEVTGAAEVQ